MKIVTEAPGLTDATQWYRGAGPLSHLSTAYPYIHVTYVKELDWGTLKGANILFLLRPCTARQVATIQTAKSLGIKVWIDYDDYLLGLPKDNPSAHFYSGDVLNNIEIALSLADRVSVSTEHLKTLFLKKAPGKISVIRNSIDPSLLKYRPKQKPNKSIVLWRGTATHQRDLLEYSDAICSVAKKYPGVNFAFIGYNPWFITERIGKQALVFPPVDLFQFNQALCSLRPGITIVPLHDSDFNRSKSNIAALEGSMAGSAVLGPDWEEWQLPGLFKYNNNDQFETQLKQMIEADLTQSADSTWNHIQDTYMLDKVNQQRLGVIHEVAEA